MAITEKIGKLGFGLMRLPQKDGKINVEETSRMVDMFLEAGYNYFDTAFVYEGSEEAIAEALVKRHPRDSYYLATKNAAYAGPATKEAAEEQLKTSLERTGAGYFDFYLLHNLGGPRTKVFEDLGIWQWCQELKEQGIIRHLGFSAHATADELDDILTKHPEAEFVQLQINYADLDSKSVQSRLCYEVARKHNTPIIVMEPVKGGLLANPPETVAKVLRDADPNVSFASWAVRYAASMDGILTVLSGMSAEDQMENNISYMKNFQPLSESEYAVIEKAREELSKIDIVPCTLCNYCAKECPVNVGISGAFDNMNLYTIYGNLAAAKNSFHWDVEAPGKGLPSACIKCGRCEEVCPQALPIRDYLEQAAEIFG